MFRSIFPKSFSLFVKPICAFLLIVVVFACSSDNNGENNPPQSMPEVDIVPPALTFTGLEANLEVLTTINVSIQDASDDVNTTISVNNDEIFSSTAKSFSFELNPFDYPTGENTLSVLSVDGDDNRREFNQTFEVEKLLARIAAPVIADAQEVYFSANTMTGELVAFAKATQRAENISLYAEDGFLPQEIVITSYILEPAAELKVRLFSLANIQPGTDLTPFQEINGVETENNASQSPLTESFDLEVTGIPTEDIANSFHAIGDDYFNSTINATDQGGTFDTALNIGNLPNTDDVVVYTSNLREVEDLVDVNDYRYLPLGSDELVNAMVPYTSFKQARSVEQTTIPANTTSYFHTLYGFLDQQAFENREYSFLFDSSPSNTGNTFSSFETPVIEEYDIVRNEINMTFDNGNSLLSSTIGIQPNIIVPNWEASLNGDIVTMSGDFDTYTLRVFASPDNSYNWEYTAPRQESLVLPFDAFEFPQEFMDYATAQSLELNAINTSTTKVILLFDASGDVPYEELLFANFIYTDRIGDVLEYTFDLD